MRNLSLFDVPNNQRVLVINAAQGSQKHFVMRKGQGLDHDLVQLQLVHQGPLLEIPDYDIRLEPHVGPLPRGNVLPGFGNLHHRDVVVVPSQERLRPRYYVPDYYSRPERENQVLVVRVQDQSFPNRSPKRYHCANLQRFLHSYFTLNTKKKKIF